MSLINTLRLSLVAAALLAGVAASPRAWAVDSETHSIVISYADLNLAKKEGVDALRHRLVVASRDVCGGSTSELSVSADYEDCRSRALQDALRDLRVAVAAASVRSSYAVANASPN